MRTVNRIGAGVLGLVLIVAGLVGTAELALAASGRAAWPAWLEEWFGRWRTTTLGDRRVLGLALGAAVLGLLIVLAEVRRWRPDRLPAGDATEGVWWLARRGVEHRATASAGRPIGVHSARARVRGGGHRWRIRVTAEAKPEESEPVEQAVRAELRRMDLPAEAPVEVALKPPRRVA
jgi:hypothetical protein